MFSLQEFPSPHAGKKRGAYPNGNADLFQHPNPRFPVTAQCTRTATACFILCQISHHPKRRPAQAIAAPSLAEEVSPQRESILPKKEPALQHSLYINKIRHPSSPGTGACGWGRRKEAGRRATALLSLPGLGMERLKGLLLPPQDKDFHLSCSHHIQRLVQTIVQRPCHRASSCHLCGF